MSDHNFFYTNPTSQFSDLSTTSGLQAYVNGVAEQYYQQDSISTDVPIALWGLGFYGEDSIKLSPSFTLTAALRFEKNANPVCNTNCFVDFNTSFPNLASVLSRLCGSGRRTV